MMRIFNYRAGVGVRATALELTVVQNALKRAGGYKGIAWSQNASCSET